MTHDAPLRWKPALQRQSTRAVLPAGEVEPAGQAVQSALPVPGLYVATAHDVQGPPLMPVYPAVQTQLRRVVLPSGDMLEAGQGVHVLVPTVYDPAVQIVQVPPFAPV